MAEKPADPVGLAAVAGIDSTGRLVCFVNGRQFHAPLSGVLTAANLEALGIGTAVTSITATANTTVSIPAGWAIEDIFFVNTTANAVTGGIRIGTTNGGTEVCDPVTVGANAIVDTSQSLDWLPQLRLFSKTVATTLYIQAVTSWNSASVDIRITRNKLF